ncbi:PTS sugar transporter subunit IIA [Schnuerera ultunensis]|uniref:PTS sugar transporter subunit IIA n=1 Tax=Schnuerera ultunensis TaxID=45497 RepID=UPI000419BCF5|nr:PTS sugar transporter subunit IIA [Schnuerera ultunensis]
MYGIVLVGHGKFPEGLLSSVDMIMGEQEYFEAINFNINDSSEDLMENIKAKIKSMEKLDGIIFLTDLIGGTPFNTCVLLSQDIENTRVLAGTNLPLLFEILTNRKLNNLDEIINMSISTGKDSMVPYIKKSNNIGNISKNNGI